MIPKLYQKDGTTLIGSLTNCISNINVTKKERLITDEVTRNQGGTMASRYSRLEARRQACDEINRKFGLNISCDYREDTRLADDILQDSVKEEETNNE